MAVLMKVVLKAVLVAVAAVAVLQEKVTAR
jgi:hypothetical protein